MTTLNTNLNTTPYKGPSGGCKYKFYKKYLQMLNSQNLKYMNE